MNQIKERIIHLKEDRPAYKEMLNFYENLVQVLDEVKPLLSISGGEFKRELTEFQIREGFHLLNKEDFAIDISSSVNLFNSLCKIGKNTNEKMKENIESIETAIQQGNLHLEELLKRHFDESSIERTARDSRINKSILNFLVHMSVLPSIHARVKKLKERVNMKNWLRSYCPICGSLPQISALKGEGQRYLLCSFCGFEWQSDRLKCPFCQNAEQNTLHYFYEEGKDAYRLDLCDKCKQYIKTIDLRKLIDVTYLELEDITTIHLDILASERGYRRPIPSPWGI
ncbi:MAG: formate dehydrogenase accessory protein FdhE [Nitrospirota bacterium]